VHLVGFIIKKFVTMHGHMNVRNSCGVKELLRLRHLVCCWVAVTFGGELPSTTVRNRPLAAKSISYGSICWRL